MKLFWRFSILICAAASILLGIHIGDIHRTAAAMVDSAAPVRYDVTYYRDGEKINAENVLVSFGDDTATLSDGTVVSTEFSEFTSRNPISTARNRTRTGVLSLLLGGIAVISVAVAAAFIVYCASAADVENRRAARSNVTHMSARRSEAHQAA